MIGEIVKGTQEAAASLAEIKKIFPEELSEERVYEALRDAVEKKLMIQAKQETNLRNLVVLSIKKQMVQNGIISESMISRHMGKYDCHQTSLAAQKKVLLQMFLERELGIKLSDDEAERIDDLRDMARIYTHHLKEDGGNGRAR